MSGNTKDKIAVRSNAGKTTPAATAPMANAYANATVPIGEERGFLRLRKGEAPRCLSRDSCSHVISRDLHISTWVLIMQVTSSSISLTFESFLPSAAEMRTESGLSPDSSSIGSRVRSSRLRVAPTESMDSSDSSLDLTAKIENPKAIIARRTSPVGGSRYPPIGPPSVIGAEEVAVWRKKYELPDDVVIQVPDPEDRVSDFGVDEVPVYEGYFASGLRDQIPSLVAKISETLGISPGQLNPPAWRTLKALQNLGDLNGLVIGVAEVLYSYSVSPLSGSEWRYHLRPRGKEPPVREILKKETKRLPAFEGNWTEKFAFMHLPGFSSIWRLEGYHRVGVEASSRATSDSFSREKSGVKALQYMGSVVSGLLALVKVERDKIGAAPYDGCLRTLLKPERASILWLIVEFQFDIGTVWLGVRDVFTQIAKDVVGQGLDHGRRSPRGLLHNQCGLSGGMTAFLDVTEGKENQKPASRMVLHKACYVNFRKFLRKTWFFERILMTHSFLEQIGQPEVDLANHREEIAPFNVHDATSILEFSSSQMFSMLFRDSLGTTETERNALVNEDFS
ncbi:hypothetical protein F2Q69_00013484 [Brassica cretica]|uniref:Uncharacterized protein n=1 Tax=Brassica cretica TaxID=69181 RepID=A0A8S9QX23_BRACR|nr:hypothetical protein F2Q69_00013484 [Brassica cretica]